MSARALDRIADLMPTPDRRIVVCHRCGFECAVAWSARLDEIACLGCVRRLEVDCRDERRALPAIRTAADWCDKAVAAGPGYGVVECPHCAARCIVEVGQTARTGCGACLLPLGSQPLLRMDCHALHDAAWASTSDLDDFDAPAIAAGSRNEDSWMWLRP